MPSLSLPEVTTVLDISVLNVCDDSKTFVHPGPASFDYGTGHGSSSVLHDIK